MIADGDAPEKIMATPQIPDGRCVHCQAPIIDLFAEWTEEYQSSDGKNAILAGEVVFDCYYCQKPLQLTLPLALIQPQRVHHEIRLAKRLLSKCEEWLRNQHPGESLSHVVERASWKFQGKWAFDGYNWGEGGIHQHQQDRPPS
jgi:hypothetical protein